MRFSLWIGPHGTWGEILSSAESAEKSGWDGLWFSDHFMPEGGDLDTPTHECWTVLAAFAALVPRLTIGSLVVGVPYRNPALVAKMAAEIDQISGGRFILGLGAGWQENEHLAYGYQFDSPGVRSNRFSEATEIITGLLSNKRTTFAGTHFRTVDAPLSPQPLQENLPILLAGVGPTRTLPLVAAKANIWNLWGTPEEVITHSKTLDRCCEIIGRDPKSLRRTAQALVFMNEDQAINDKMRSRKLPASAIIGTPADIAVEIQKYADAGIDEFIVPDFNFRSNEDRKRGLQAFRNEIVGQFTP